MGIPTQKVKDFIQAIRNEPVKMFRVYDGGGRLITQYEAVTHAQNGDPCMRSDYSYTDASSFKVEKMKETIDLWSASYEMP